MMKISQKGVDLIKHFEGLRLESYQCPAGKWTIGYGHVRLVEEGDICDQDDAEAALKYDLEWFEQEVNHMVKEQEQDLKQQEFDALVSFAFNLGSEALWRSTLMKHLKAGNHTLAAQQFTQWIYANKKPLRGLLIRRNAEQRMFLGL